MFVLSQNNASTPSSAELREAVQVEVLAVERRLVDLEVAGVEEDALPACGWPARRSRACCA